MEKNDFLRNKKAFSGICNIHPFLFFMKKTLLMLLWAAFSLQALAQTGRDYPVRAFDKLRVSGPVLVTLRVGSPAAVQVQADETLLDNEIRVENNGRELLIKRSWEKPVSYTHLTLPTICSV